jgi:hypothetical protein
MIKIKQPKKLKIGSYVYKVKVEDDLMLTQGNSGEHRPHYMEIAIDKKVKSKTPVFLHESLHAINDNYVLHLDEDTIDALSHGVSEVLDNLGIAIVWE